MWSRLFSLRCLSCKQTAVLYVVSLVFLPCVVDVVWRRLLPCSDFPVQLFVEGLAFLPLCALLQMLCMIPSGKARVHVLKHLNSRWGFPSRPSQRGLHIFGVVGVVSARPHPQRMCHLDCLVFPSKRRHKACAGEGTARDLSALWVGAVGRMIVQGICCMRVCQFFGSHQSDFFPSDASDERNPFEHV